MNRNGIYWILLLIVLLGNCSKGSEKGSVSDLDSLPSELSDSNFLQDPQQIAYGSYFLVRNSCISCHKIGGLENKRRSFAPPLDNIGNKVHSEWIQLWLENPNDYSKHSKMPRFFLKEDENTALTRYLMSLKDSEQAPVKTQKNEGNPEIGKRIFQNSGCIQCHIRGSNEKKQNEKLTEEIWGGTLGPELTNLSEKLQEDWLLAFLEDPKKFYPNTLMPTYDFSAKERLDLASYLLENSEGGSKTTEADELLIEKGKNLFREKACLQCHAVKGEIPMESLVDLHFIQNRDPWSIYPGKEEGKEEAGISASRSLTLAESLFLKIKDSQPSPEFAMPQYTLSDQQILSMTAYLLNQKDQKNEEKTEKEAWTLSNHWDLPIPLQSRVPDEYSLQESSLDPKSCGLCHTEQYKDWKESRHAKAMGPGVLGQFLESKDPTFIASCKLCHAPLSEQNEVLDYWNGSEWEYRKNFSFDSDLAQTGINCAACHVRSHKRFSSLNPSLNPSLNASGLKSRVPHGSAEGKSDFSESRFCAVCHQFSSEGLQGQILNGKPLENTFNEWQNSSWAKQGITCQDCHMPKKQSTTEHTWKGIHDPDFVRSAIRLKVELVQTKPVTAKIELLNEGAGHHFPTYATPSVFLIAELLDSQNTPLAQTRKQQTIQRALNSTLSKELFDTRIPSGNSHLFLYQVPKPANAKILRVQVRVSPDFFYQKFFKQKLSHPKSSPSKTLYQSALQDIQHTDYILYQREILLK